MCQSRAQGGQRCSAHTGAVLAKATEATVRTAINRHVCDAQVTSAEAAVIARYGGDPSRIPADVIDLDPGVCEARNARYAADEASIAARREHEAALVEHATTEAGRSSVLAMLAAANDKGDVNGAARLHNVLLRAQDTATARAAARHAGAAERRGDRVLLYG